MRTPVAFIIFNRPDLTERVFTEIARARPEKFLVIADGPRPEWEGDAEKCAAARAIIERVDWPCDILKNYSDGNMGCARRPATGLQWVFDQVEEAIILEDDCVPHPAFFRYCGELLERYRDDERIMHISGDQFIAQAKVTPFSYSFSRYCLSWGWATWRRAFRHYDPEIKLWPTLRETQWLSDILGDKRAVEHWRKIFDLTFSSIENVNTWDFQWVFACWAQFGLSVLPNANLISNIGFRKDATHTKRATDSRANIPNEKMIFPLKHPAYMMRDQERDKLIFEEVVVPGSRRSFVDRLRGKCAAAVPNSVRKSFSSLRSRFAPTVGQS
jgi:hypothetical protein